jgi:hypothetical protein
MGKVWESGAVQVVQCADSLSSEMHPCNRLRGAEGGWPAASAPLHLAAARAALLFFGGMLAWQQPSHTPCNLVADGLAPALVSAGFIWLQET